DVWPGIRTCSGASFVTRHCRFMSDIEHLFTQLSLTPTEHTCLSLDARKLLDRGPLSPDPRAHRAAGVASDMIERTAPAARRATQAAVSPRRGFTSDKTSAEAG